MNTRLMSSIVVVSLGFGICACGDRDVVVGSATISLAIDGGVESGVDELPPSPTIPLPGADHREDAIGISRGFGAGSHTERVCVRTASGKLGCFGDHRLGAIGEASSVEPGVVYAPFGSKVLGVASGTSHTCARLEGGLVGCWGNEELGMPTPSQGNIPVLGRITGAIQIAAFASTTCAVLFGGTVFCWGGHDGFLGFAASDKCGTLSCTKTPTMVPSLDNATRVVVGPQFQCALKKDGTVWCWGKRSFCQPGDEACANHAQPSQVLGLDNVKQIAAGASGVLAVKNDGTLWGWGQVRVGEQDVTGGLEQVQSRTNIAQVDFADWGNVRYCDLSREGRALCEGGGSWFMIEDHGNGTSELEGVSSISTGLSITCAFRTDSQFGCWGRTPTPAGPDHGYPGFTPIRLE